MKRVLAVAGMVVGCAAAGAQWTLQESHTTASLRGVHSVDGKVAWASGSGGTVLRTVDGGAHWQVCAVPPEGEKLDFRGVQAFDAQTAIVMSSGKGDLSRLYKTTDGCATWKLEATNDAPEGFWDSLKMWTPTDGFLAGDPVDGYLYFAENTSYWNNFLDQGKDRSWLARKPDEAAFAGSNSSLALGTFGKKDGESRQVWFATGGTAGARIFHYQHFNGGEPERQSLTIAEAPMFPHVPTGGVYSLYFRTDLVGVAVGGDYKKPNAVSSNAAFCSDGNHWNTSASFPNGYRSSVNYYPRRRAWITVGPNGTDVSTDDGRNWRALRPSAGEFPDADKNWNALSLPFVVGSKGRIGILRAAALGAKDK